MASLNPIRAWRRFLGRPNTDPVKTVGIAFLVALVCSVVVSASAVYLKPLQDANRLRESAASLFEIVETLGLILPKMRLVNRISGDYVQRSSAAKTQLSPDQDQAGLHRIENTLKVYEIRDRGQLQLVILPVRGAGYKSTIHGFLALRNDLNTIAALTFHQQDETPGMGARIMEKSWQALWRDKKIAATNGAIRIRVVKGGSSGVHEVDGISGATRTGRGVANLVRFWLGDFGYGPYLERLGQKGKR
jgi:Na+-transporting NADH:ubiquinone oxidoreductase subunit C